MEIYSSSRFGRELKRLSKRDEKLTTEINSRIALLKTEPQHSSLRLHKLTGRESEEWSITIKRNIRLIFRYIPDGILLTDIGSHDEVY